MYSRIKHLHEELKVCLADKSFSSLTEEAQLTYCRQKLELATLAFAEYEKLKSDAEQALIAAELLFIATWLNSGMTYNERDSKSINQESLNIDEAMPCYYFEGSFSRLWLCGRHSKNSNQSKVVFAIFVAGI